MQSAPRLIIAGTGGDSGKTLISLGLIASWRQKGMKVAAFKKGPDYIDSAWLEMASGSKSRNLDTFMMGRKGVLACFQRNSRDSDVSLIEGNRGLFDGWDVEGTHSTAQLAKLLNAPVILVQDVTKMTRTAAASVLGCQGLDPDVNLAGVILNRVANLRHEKMVRESIESICRIPVLGAVPRFSSDVLLPGRHLGLVTPQEHSGTTGLMARLADLINYHCDVNLALAIAGSAAPVEITTPLISEPPAPQSADVRIAYFNDSAFTFYYQDNIEALETAGAQLIPVSSLKSPYLPPCEGLFIGGGFPETHAAQIAANRSLLASVKRAAHDGLPIYAECGGLIFLSRTLRWKDQSFPLAGVFPLDIEMTPKPQGHGYMNVRVDVENFFFPVGTRISGHEFHYTRICSEPEAVKTIYEVERGHGCFRDRDGLISRNVLAGYLHLHTAGAPQWAANFVNMAKAYKKDG